MEEITLYAIPFACSLAPHIALRESGAPHRIDWVARNSLAMAGGRNFASINAKGKVAALRRTDGSLLTENVAILAELCSEAPPLEWLAFINSEIHSRLLWPYFDPLVPEAMKAHVAGALATKTLRHPERALAAQPFLIGEAPSPADAYLFWALFLLPQLGVALEEYPALLAFRERMQARRAVKEALAIERQGFAAVAAFTEAHAHV